MSIPSFLTLNFFSRILEVVFSDFVRLRLLERELPLSSKFAPSGALCKSLNVFLLSIQSWTFIVAHPVNIHGH
jgi:hypothetical protein